MFGTPYIDCGLHEISTIKNTYYLTRPIEVKFAISPKTLEERLNKHKGEDLMLITNFLPDSHFPEDEYKERREALTQVHLSKNKGLLNLVCVNIDKHV